MSSKRHPEEFKIETVKQIVDGRVRKQLSERLVSI
jgi:hypothetical protein